MKKLIKRWIPIAILDVLKSRGKYGWFGDYASWEEAKRDSSGYDSQHILEKVKNAMMTVKNGGAAFERDSVLFMEEEYNMALCCGLLRVAAKYGNSLNVVDFGGSLGSSYFQNRRIFSGLKELKWNIIEQKGFVDCGKENFEDSNLKFYYRFEDCLKENRPNVLLLSSVLAYIEDVYGLLEEIMRYDFPHIIVDITQMVDIGRDRITVQKVPPEIYTASYPCRLLDKEDFIRKMGEKYQKIIEFKCYNGQEHYINHKDLFYYYGFYFDKIGI